ncbi:23S rRNA (guanosine(2251)-2'-O)-methyltransferase RlmB [Devriesea agamarum]|uniref:23S rRNA (guanosine(2251)-2'-O)-methyltransferase RlmB n=1 Tax=Devriesea agamarum TaxID=472569 RepID=UPI00071D57CB|nr:23S rRNA (guanosine(2251)-2'-O)-methyltransferase RlmB [Devriesea agamarum]
MAGNSSRRGAVRRTKKARSVGSGGVRRRGLEGKGPTPKAENRPGHKAYRNADGSGAGRTDRRDSQRASESVRGSSAGAGRSRRAGSDTEVIAGRNAVLEALRGDVPVVSLHLAHRIDVDDRVREIMRLAAERRLPLMEGTRTDLDRLSDGAVHQGVALKIPPYRYAHPDDLLTRAQEEFDEPLLIALDGITDPRNLGAVLRSAGAFGAHGVVIPERRSVGMTAAVWKVAAGAAGRIPVAQVVNLTRALQDLKSRGVFVVGLDAGSSHTVRSCSLSTGPVCLVIGSEGKGLSRLVRETCDEIVSIPIEAATESLNASVAAGIALYEFAAARAEAGRG